MRVLVTGSNGMLGSDLIRMVGAEEEIIGIGRSANQNTGLRYYECDICDRERVFKLIEELACDWVIHTAAFSNVDGCEKDPKTAEAVNVGGSENIADACSKHKIRAILISTDYVFDGKKKSPYDESDEPKPLSVYGRTKLEAERIWQNKLRRGIVLRTSWLFGRLGRNFVDTITRQAEQKQSLRVVCDQWGAPTHTVDLAKALHRLMKGVESGTVQAPSILHFTNSGATSRYEWARYIVRELGLNPDEVKPIRTEETGRPARRPAYGVLGIGLWKKIFKEMPKDMWQATSEYLQKVSVL